MISDIPADLIPIEHNQTDCIDCSVRRLALFQGVKESDLSWTKKYRAHQFTVQAHKEIYHESKISKYMFTLYHGWVAMYKTLASGKRQILRIALPGDMLGFHPDLAAPMTHSAYCLTESVLCAFPCKDMPELLRRNLSVTKRLTELNARDMDICQSRLLTIGQQTAIERIAFFSAELFFRIKAIYNQQENFEIQFPLSQEEIGDATGLTKIHVNRTLKALREMGIMQISGKSMKIFDIDALSKLGNFDANSVYARPLY